MQDWQTFGHNRIKNILYKQMNGQNLAHAYLFCGPSGIGKKTLALELAKKILETENLTNHPDFQMLDQEGEIGTESAVEFIRSLNFKPFVASKKVAIINNAHNLNKQSSNALLKTLEEPGKNTIIILIVNEGRQLPTIVSRCQVFNFQVFIKTDLLKYAEVSKINTTPEIIDLSFGKINRLQQLVSDKDFYLEQKSIVQKYQEFSKKTSGEKLLAISQYSDLESPELEENFMTWMYWQTENLYKKPQDASKLQALSDAILALKFNQNKKLVLQGLFLKL